MDRLLTKEEWDAACTALPGGTRCGDCRIALCQAQADKVAAIVDAEARADERKRMARWLRNLPTVTEEYIGQPDVMTGVELPTGAIEALARGERPEGME